MIQVGFAVGAQADVVAGRLDPFDLLGSEEEDLPVVADGQPLEGGALALRWTQESGELTLERGRRGEQLGQAPLAEIVFDVRAAKIHRIHQIRFLSPSLKGHPEKKGRRSGPPAAKRGGCT